MQKDILDTQPQGTLYKESSVQIATFLGGPIIAGYLLAENFKTLHQFDKIKLTWFYAVGVTVLLIVFGFFVPGMDQVPNYVFPIMYTMATAFVLLNYQSDQIQKHIENGGKIHSIWRGLLIGVTGLIITWGIIFVLTRLTNAVSQSNKVSEVVTFIAKVDIANATKDGIYLNGYVVNIDYEHAKKLSGKKIKVTGKVTIQKGLEDGDDIRQGREEDAKRIESPKIQIIED